MATVRQRFMPEDAQLPASAFAQFTKTDGTNFPYSVLWFDGAAADELVYFRSRITNYGSGNLTAKLRWIAATATSGNVVWGAALAAVTPESDSGSLSAKAFATAQTIQDTHLGTTALRVMEATLTISNLDSVADGDEFILQVYRDASDTVNDTLAGDAGLISVDIEYSDT